MGQPPRGFEKDIEDVVPTTAERTTRAVRARPIAAAVFVAIAVGALVRGQLHWAGHRFDPGLWWILGGLLAAIVARRLCPGRRAAVPRRWSWAEGAVVIVLTLAAGAVRFPALDHLPPGGFFDEAQNGIVGRQILAGDRPVFVAAATQMPALFFYLVAAALRVGGDTLTSVRGLAALLGTLTIPVFYLLARRVTSRVVAAAAAILIAGSRWHVTFSRVGFTGIFNPLLELLAAFFLLRALETGRRRYFAALGLVVGVGLQTYYAFNLFPVVLTAILAVRVFASPGRRPRLLATARGLALAALVAVVVLAPLLHFAYRQPEVFFQRTSTVGIWNPAHNLPFEETLRAHIGYHLQMFNYIGDVNGRHNIPDAPQLGIVAGVLFLLGMAATLARPLSWPGAAWLVWFVVMLLPGILTIEAPQAYRTIGVIPVLYLITAQGLALVADLVRGVRGGWKRAIVHFVVIAAALAAAAEDVDRYFRVQVRSPQAWDSHDANHTQTARFTAAHQERYAVWVDPLHSGSPIFQFRARNGDYQAFITSQHFPLDPKRVPANRAGAAYALQAYAADLQPLFLALYPHAQVTRHLDPFGRPSYVSVIVPREDLLRAHDPAVATGGFTAAFYANGRWQGTPTLVRRDPTVLFHYHSEPLPDPFTVDWSARLHITAPGEYRFRLAAAGPAVLIVDGTPILSQRDYRPDLGTQEAAVTLKAGSHLLVLRYHEDSFVSAVRLWWARPNEGTSLIPMDALQPLTLAEYEGLRATLPEP